MKNALVPAMTTADRADLLRARGLLETPGLAMKLANLVGTPVEYLLARKLPGGASRIINRACRRAVEAGYNTAAATLDVDRLGAAASPRAHKWAVAGTGALGGFFGFPGLLVELPLTTAAMLRSVADIARSEGESPGEPATRLACIEVLALGGASTSDDAAESGYFATRAALAQQVSATARYLAGTLGSGSAPAVMRVVNAVASRFSIPVTQKAMAQAAPIIGAASGAALNLIFISHFQNAARGHFIVRRLERKYGPALVRHLYDAA